MTSVLVIGAGFMGGGIAQVCAQAGYRVHLMDVRRESLDKALGEIRKSTIKLHAKGGRIPEPPETILARIELESDLKSAANVQWVIEASPEIESLKKEIFLELDELVPTDTVLATNTSSIPVSRLAAVTGSPERVLGLHFFGPVPLMGLVEVVKGDETSASVFDRGIAFVKSLGKTPVCVQKDVPGFVMNRIFLAAFREALALVDLGVVTPEDADTGMKLGYGWTVGPFEIADNAGIDTFDLIARSFNSIGEDMLCPQSDLLKKMVGEGRLGRKSGEGFYRYSKEGKRFSI
jgi:3-hydroxybutyryl-CoA dehydrogenase